MATSDIKRAEMKKMAGAWRKTPLDNDEIWREVMKKKSRKKEIIIDHK